MRFAIVSPATEIRHHYMEGAVAELKRRGHSVMVMPSAIGRECGTYAATDAERLDDLKAAISDPDIDAILCSRGGYGCVHLLSEELLELVKANKKWLIGFSDVSALHALWLRAGAPSIHCSMAKQLALCNPDLQNPEIKELLLDELDKEPAETRQNTLMQIRDCTREMFSILQGEGLTYTAIQKAEARDAEAEGEKVDGAKAGDTYGKSAKAGFPLTREANNDNAETPENIPGEAEGEIIGGNLAVLNGLAATPWDILSPGYARGKIIFLEDVGEKIYQVERMLKRLQMAGTLNAAAALIFGNFTEYRPDKNFSTMEQMISQRLKEWGIKIPVVYRFPIGHTHVNHPIPQSAQARLKVSPHSAIITIRGNPIAP